MEKLYSAPIEHPERDLEDYPGFAGDPSLRKFSADIEQLGGRHFTDIGIEPTGPSGNSYIRLYLLPEATVFSVMLFRGNDTLTTCPCRPSFLLKTFFSDGSYLVSVNSHSGYRKAFSELPIITRVYPGVTHPEQMLERHRRTVGRLLQQGKQLGTVRVEEYIPHLLEEHEQTRELMGKYGFYTWDAAFRMAFDQPRREYLD